jgi:UDP-N-acetylmuramoyl-L-alanyl-D-glutamate--2,6-diaminopimelate ligase
MKLSDLIKNVPLRSVTGDTGLDVKGITKDSRRVSEGYLFFVTDSSSPFLSDARRRGAVGVVSDRSLTEEFPCTIITPDPAGLLGTIASRYYQYPSKRLSVVGVTGTNGKTTTTYLVESILSKAGRKTGVIGTITHRYNGHSLKAGNTTPGAEELQLLLKEMVGAGIEQVIMEVSSHALDQRRVEGVHFDTGVFTNLTHDHLDYHGTLERYKEAKRLLFSHYLAKSEKSNRSAILNLDDPAAREFAPGAPVRTLFYSLREETDAYLTSFEEDIRGLSMNLSLLGKQLTIRSPLLGIFNASNILAACLCGRFLGVSPDVIKAGVESLEGVPGRLERVRNAPGIPVFVDYAHTPDALRKVLELLNRLKRGRLIAIFGCGGDRDRTKRPLMGAAATGLADYTIITSDNPRGEEPAKIIEEIQRGVRGNPYKVVADRREAISEGLAMAAESDVVLVAGKGHEDYQIIGKETYHFSDREVVEEFFGVAR